MHRLQKVNFQKCIDVLEDFVEATPSVTFDGPLKEKKRHAEQSLEQMRGLLSASDVENLTYNSDDTCSDPDCNSGTCKQNTN
jgi:hypothetical protein